MAREITTHNREDLFAASPPLDAMKTILYMTATANKGEVFMINGISRVFFHAQVKRAVFVQLAKEVPNDGEEGMCGKLQFSMYEIRDVAQNWFEEHSSQLRSIGFQQDKATPCVFHRPTRNIRTMVQGDVYISTGMPQDLKWRRQQLEAKYQVKTQVLGPGEEEVRQVKVLNRVVTWDGARGITYEVDPRHVEIVIQQLKLQEAKPVATPGTK